MAPHRQGVRLHNLLLITLAYIAFTTAQANNPAPNQPPAPTSAAQPSDATSAAVSTAASTAASSVASGAQTTQPPSLTSASASSQPALPTVSDWLPPPLIVPDTSNAPFMQRSSLPEGTVFICVGGVLGFLGLCVLAWRGLVAWSLHRNVKKAAITTYASDTKSMFGLGGGPTYKSVDTGSYLSLDQLTHTNTSYGGAGGDTGRRDRERQREKHDRQDRHADRSLHQQRSSRTPSSTNLFFSPTAGAGAGLSSPRNSYMPAGYYAAGATAPNSGSSIVQLGGDRPPKEGYSRVHSSHSLSIDSPPESPALKPRRDSTGAMVGGRSSPGRTSPAGRISPAHNNRHSHRGSSGGVHEPTRRSRLGYSAADSSLTLNGPPQGRAPSAYLEDLFENHGHGPRERF